MHIPAKIPHRIAIECAARVVQGALQNFPNRQVPQQKVVGGTLQPIRSYPNWKLMQHVLSGCPDDWRLEAQAYQIVATQALEMGWQRPTDLEGLDVVAACLHDR